MHKSHVLVALTLAAFGFLVSAAPAGAKFQDANCVALIDHLGAIDQSQCLTNAGLSARTSTRYKILQSFTAGKTGTLTEIDMGFFNPINGTGLFEVYIGESTDGQKLISQQTPVVCVEGQCPVPFLVSVPVVRGQKYTFQFTPLWGMPDPYGVLLSNPGKYSKGGVGIVGPGGTYTPNYDLVFSTFVN